MKSKWFTTLELEWYEHDVNMRLNIYFANDGENWYASEIETYNGGEEGESVYYEDTYFTTALGEAYEGDFSAKSSSYSIVFENLNLQAFTATE